MKKPALIILLALHVIWLYAQIDIHNVALVYDRQADRYLCSVPESMFDNGSVEAFQCDTAKVEFTFLPIVQLHGSFSNDYTIGSVDVFMPDNDNKTSLPAKIKWRGGTSNSPTTHKRNYHIKFVDENGDKQDRKFYGLRKDDSWLLNAANNDLSRIRNRAAMDIWNEFAVKPYYAEYEPKVQTGTHGFFVELFLNDEYMGIYDMSENIDRQLLKLKKYDNDQTIHGQLWKGKSFENACMWNLHDYDNTSAMWGGFETKYPDLDDVSPTDYSTLYNMIYFVREASVEQFNNEIGEYIDMSAMVDYFVFMNIIAAVDNYSGKNMFWACYDKQADKKLTPIVWDLDCTIGRYFNPDEMDPYYLAPDTYDDIYWGNKLFYRLDSCATGSFHQLCVERYKQLRTTYFATDNITSHYTKYMDQLTKSGAYQRETAKWSGDSDLFGQTLDFAAERMYIENWINVRLNTFDYHGLPTTIQPVYAEQSDSFQHNGIGSERIYNICGQRVNSIRTPGIYIRNGRKIIER